MSQEKYAVRGIMELYNLLKCGFDPILSFVIDCMHNVFLGVAKQLARLHFRRKFSDEPWSVRKHLKEIDKILKSISKSVTHEFSRAPRGFDKNFCHYKGVYNNCLTLTDMKPNLLLTQLNSKRMAKLDFVPCCPCSYWNFARKVLE